MKSDQTVSPIYLGFASQKGGVGKSSLAEVLASILYYEKGIPLTVVDCDGTQESFYKLRERERNIIDESPDIAEQLKAFFTKFGKRASLYFGQSQRTLSVKSSNCLNRPKKILDSLSSTFQVMLGRKSC